MERSCWVAPLLLLCALPLLSGAETSPRFAAPIGNQEVIASRNAVLKCVVEDLGDYRVAWIHLERQMILTIHDKVITSIPRFRLVQDDPNTWVLHISQVQRSDGGLYMCQVNTAPLMSQIGSLKVYEAPEIEDARSSKSAISVRNRDNVTLTCAARGVPEPTIEWTREDGRPLRAAGHHGHHGTAQHGQHGQHGHHNRHGQHGHHRNGQDEGTSHLPMVIKGNTLNLTQVTPSDMGSYLCIAKNDIPPTVSKRIQLYVEFKPMIWVPNQLVSGVQGSSVKLECRSEAHPPPIVYWLKKTDSQERLIIQDRKYQGKYDIRTINNEYETEMVLRIYHLNASDYGSYMCVCKNYIGEVVGSINLYEVSQPTTDRMTTAGYRPVQPATDLVTFRNSGRERGGETGDVYIPAAEEEEEEREEEMERERKRYKLKDGSVSWEQEQRRRGGKAQSGALRLTLDAVLTLVSSLAALL